MIELLKGHTFMEWWWAVFFALSALIAWFNLEALERDNSRCKHTAWHITLPAWVIKITGLYLAAVYSQHALFEDVGELAEGTPIDGWFTNSVTIIWGIAMLVVLAVKVRGRFRNG